MDKNYYNKKRLEYEEKGYCIIKDLLSVDLLEKAHKDILESKDTSVFKDQSGKLRRIESIYDKTSNLKLVYKSCLEILSNIFSKEFYIFKDKYNAKPPGGEGFFAHYDGIFEWIDADGNKRNGWYEYADMFVNVLASIDPMTAENGALEVSNEHKGSFSELLKNTKGNNTPDLKKSVEDSLDFEKIIINSGDIVLFSNKCPHRSSKNTSNSDRRTIYYTFNPKDQGDNYLQYFLDKNQSKDIGSKSLSGEI